MEREGFLEFSLGCLPHVVRCSQRDKLVFPLILQVLDSTDCQSRISNKNGRFKNTELRKIISVSDGFYSKVDCFLLTSNIHLDTYTVIKVHNIDFEHNLERQKDRPRISGMILEFDIIARGTDIGYFSGKPSLLRDLGTHSRWGRGDNIIHSTDSLSSKLWKQVKEGRCCDVTFTFPHCASSPSATIPTVKAQKNALIANSPVFEAQFEGGFSDASSEEVAILDTEPKYMRCLLQFIFTRFVPLLSLRQAFEVLYLARKYIIQDLESYCKNFIMNNKKSLAGVTDVFQYLEMNGKSCDDDINQFVWSRFRSCANVLIRQPRFIEIDFDTLETFLSEPELNCHEWELIQAVRRWVNANNAAVKCEEVDSETCAHQLIECIRWNAMPIKECVLALEWNEFKLYHDRGFLSDVMEDQRRRDGRNLSHVEVVPSSINKEYSLNRLYHDDSNFVIYSSLVVDPLSLNITCLHGQSAAQYTFEQTKCSTIGPPFELISFYIVPSYGLSNISNNRVRLTVNLSCQGKSFNADSDNSDWVRSMVLLTVFSFSPEHPAKEMKKELNFWPDRDSSNFISVVFCNNELDHYLRTEDGNQKLDLQLQFNTDLNSDWTGRVSPPKIMKPLRTCGPRVASFRQRTTYDNRIDIGPHRSRLESGVGRTVSYLRTGSRRSGWGNINPQSQEWRGGRRSQSPERVADNTIEIQTPEYDQSDAYGNVTRSPQSPGSFVEVSRDPHRYDNELDNEMRGFDYAADIWEVGSVRERLNPSPLPSPLSPERDPLTPRLRSPMRPCHYSPNPTAEHGYSPSPSRSPSPRPGPSGCTLNRRRAHRETTSPYWSRVRYQASSPTMRSPSASPPRHPQSPVVVMKPIGSPDSPEYHELYPFSASPKYERSPSVIDIDLEETEDLTEKTGDSKKMVMEEEYGTNENVDGNSRPLHSEEHSSEQLETDTLDVSIQVTPSEEAEPNVHKTTEDEGSN